MAAAIMVAENSTFENEVMGQAQPVLVYFWATWCQSCKLMSPQMEKLATENADRFKTVKVEIGTNPELAEKYNIMSTPTILLFLPNETAPKEVQVGFASKDWVNETITALLKK